MSVYTPKLVLVLASEAQYPEARSFARAYNHDPEPQACLAFALLGFQSVCIAEGRDTTSFDNVLQAFGREFPEFLTPHTMQELHQFEPSMDSDYQPDPRVVASIWAGNHDAIVLNRWPEASEFDAVYRNDPFMQARLAMALIGMRGHMAWKHDEVAVDAINVVLGYFVDKYPTFTQNQAADVIESRYFRGRRYLIDDRLTYFLGPLAVESART
jgi:hypothetical protein